MHYLEPNTIYQRVLVELIVKAGSEDEATDGINEMLRRDMMEAEGSQQGVFVADYSLHPVGECTVVGEPEEGCLCTFDPKAIKAPAVL